MNPWIKHALQGIGGGTAIALGLAAIKAVENQPTFLPQLLGGNAPLFTVLLVAMFLGNQRFGQFTELQTRNVEANEKLAAGVNALVTKDDERAREQEITLNYLARNSDETQRILRDHCEWSKDVTGRFDKRLVAVESRRSAP